MRYESYKSSGVAWLGEIPEHWDLIPTRGLLRESKKVVGKNFSQYTLLSLTLNGIIARDMKNMKGKFASDMSSYQVVQKGDFIFCLFDVDETPRTVGLSSIDGMITGAYTVLKCLKPESSKFIYFYYLAMDNNKSFKPLYTGLRKVIPKPSFMGAKIPFPPFEEQKAIVRYLSFYEHKINKAIHVKKKLIATLGEQKQAIIAHAVTKGVDLHVKMKPSDISWLSEIPEHWDSKYLGACFSERREKVSDKIFKALSVTKKGIVPQLETAAKSNAGDNRKKVLKGDFVINGRSDRKGSSGISYLDGSVSLINIVLKPKELFLSKYTHYLLRSVPFQEEYYRNGKGIVADLWSTNISEMRKILLPIPPLEEQKAIVDFIEQETAAIDKAIELSKKEIELLEEYKTRLIADVVTGAVDVREEAQNLPQIEEDSTAFESEAYEAEEEEISDE